MKLNLLCFELNTFGFTECLPSTEAMHMCERMNSCAQLYTYKNMFSYTHIHFQNGLGGFIFYTGVYNLIVPTCCWHQYVIFCSVLFLKIKIVYRLKCLNQHIPTHNVVDWIVKDCNKTKSPSISFPYSLMFFFFVRSIVLFDWKVTSRVVSVHTAVDLHRRYIALHISL